MSSNYVVGINLQTVLELALPYVASRECPFLNLEVCFSIIK